MTQITIGDVWKALDQAHIVPDGAALGHAYIHYQGKSLRLANRGFVDNRVAPSSVLNMVRGWGVTPVASRGLRQQVADRFARLNASLQNVSVSTTAPLLMADTADPGTTVIPNVNAVAGYIGGWTPHVWTLTQWKAQTAPVMPIWTYNPNLPGATQGTTDGQAALAKAKSLGIPVGTAICLDMETSQDQPYCFAFRNAIRGVYWTRIYGSASFIFANWATPDGPAGGWWPAAWNGIPHMYSDSTHTNIWATQYADATMANLPWDMSEIVDLSHLWYPNATTYKLTVTAKSPTSSVTKSANFVVNT